jgi:hypothetical protein
MSVASYVFFGLAWCVMLGGIISYILKGSKGDLNVMHAFTYILSFMTVGAVLMVIGILVA